MNLNRRTALRLAGVGVVGALAGCLGDRGDGNGAPDGGDGNGASGDGALAEYDVTPFAVRTGLGPEWPGDEATGRVVVIDSDERLRAALGPYDIDGERRDELEDAFEDIDFDTERLLLVESVGPNACYSRLDIENVRTEDGSIRADATVEDESDSDTSCAQVVTYPSTLLRVTFDEEPLDDATLEVTDGWGDTSTVTASADGSLSPDPEDLEGFIAPEGDPAAVEPLECEDEPFERHGQWFEDADVHLGDFDDNGETVLSMRADDTAYERGDTVDIRLTNVADETVDTGNRNKYNLQVFTEDGWQDVRGADEGLFAYTDEAIIHPPGDGFEWSLELTEDGVVEDAVHDFRVCPGLPAGRYRFAFFGVIGDGALAVEFDLTS